jgi:hypothetical protein
MIISLIMAMIEANTYVNIHHNGVRMGGATLPACSKHSSRNLMMHGARMM